MDKRDDSGVILDQVAFSMHQVNLLAELAKQAPYEVAAKLLAVLQQGQRISTAKPD